MWGILAVITSFSFKDVLDINKDYEVLPASSEAMIYITMTRLMVRRDSLRITFSNSLLLDASGIGRFCEGIQAPLC